MCDVFQLSGELHAAQISVKDLEQNLPDRPFKLGCPDLLSLVGGPLLGKSCGSQKEIWFLLFHFTCFIYSIYFC